jgi:hypothetical protein
VVNGMANAMLDSSNMLMAPVVDGVVAMVSFVGVDADGV